MYSLLTPHSQQKRISAIENALPHSWQNLATLEPQLDETEGLIQDELGLLLGSKEVLLGAAGADSLLLSSAVEGTLAEGMYF